MNETWKKGISKQGKFPSKPFSAVLVAMYPSENKNETKLLQLDFADEQQVGIYGLGKAKVTDDEVTVSGSLADFQASLEALGYACMWGTDDNNEIMGFKTEPDIIGSKVWIEPLEEQTIGDDTQTKKSIFWGIVTKIEKVTATTTSAPGAATKSVRPGKLPKEPKIVDTPKSNVDITGIVIDALDVPKSISDLFTGLSKKYKVSELREAI
ncbi:MAG: hypothetical protein Q8M94_20920, partial [Ignavibacteria bacterium]|nr:hypothetical protein [Ignavibacteria bacterium]